jgi:hypothetical protein
MVAALGGFMATDVEKVLKKIDVDNNALQAGRANLKEAFEKIDGRINAMGAGLRIEPYAAGKTGLVIGFRRYHTGWHISTVLVGVADIESEIPVTEATAATQVALIAHVGGLLEKLQAVIAGHLKETNTATKEAERLVEAVRAL